MVRLTVDLLMSGEFLPGNIFGEELPPKLLARILTSPLENAAHVELLQEIESETSLQERILHRASSLAYLGEKPRALHILKQLLDFSYFKDKKDYFGVLLNAIRVPAYTPEGNVHF